jgi:uncharacterized protein (DUF1330 family)
VAHKPKLSAAAATILNSIAGAESTSIENSSTRAELFVRDNFEPRSKNALPGVKRHVDLREQGRMQMPKGYWVTTYRSIKDPDKLAAYAKLAPVAIAPFGAKYIVRGTATAASEAGTKQRVVISVFDSVAKAIAAHDSPAYQAAVKVLGDGAERDVRIVEGLE